MVVKGTNLFIEKIFDSELKNHLNMLIYFYHLFENKHQSNNFCSTVFFNELVNKVTIIKTNSNYYATHCSSKPFQPMILDEARIQQWSASSIYKKIDALLRDTSPSKLEQRFLIAASFYVDAIQAVEDLKLLYSVIGLESLLSTKNDLKESGLSTNLAEKVAFLFSDNLKQRLQIRKHIKNLYDYRSDVGHGKKRYDTIQEAHRAEDYLFHTMKLFLDKLNMPNGFREEEDLDNWFLRKKMNSVNI